jgi:surfeit locus 1 family protein
VTERMPAPPRRRGLLIPAFLVLGALAVLLGLGTWQLERKAWKEALIDTLSRRLAAAPVELPAPEQWTGLDAAQTEFRRVAFRAQFLNDREALVFTTGSTLRADTAGPGYWVFTPARLSDASVVVVNRGFVAQAAKEPASRSTGQISGVGDIVGALRWPEARGLFTPADDPAGNLWFVRDHLAMAAARNWGKVAPFYVEQEAPSPPGGWPRPGRLQVSLPNNHLQYAVTWYALAAVLAVLSVIFTWGRWREARATRCPQPRG